MPSFSHLFLTRGHPHTVHGHLLTVKGWPWHVQTNLRMFLEELQDYIQIFILLWTLPLMSQNHLFLGKITIFLKKLSFLNIAQFSPKMHHFGPKMVQIKKLSQYPKFLVKITIFMIKKIRFLKIAQFWPKMHNFGPKRV